MRVHLSLTLLLSVIFLSIGFEASAKASSLKNCLQHLLAEVKEPQDAVSLDEVKKLHLEWKSHPGNDFGGIQKKEVFQHAFNKKLREIIAFIANQPMTTQEKVTLWKQYVVKIQDVDPYWKMKEFQTVGGQFLFTGGNGKTILIDSNGKVYRGVVNADLIEELRDHTGDLIKQINPEKNGYIAIMNP